MIDCTFRTEEGRFYYCVRGIILRNNKLLAMHDEVSPYYYLPGGKVAMGETAEEAMLREVLEELQVKAKIVRPLWLCQNFFTLKKTNEQYHEIGLYFLLDIPDGTLTTDQFVLKEGKHTLRFKWLEIEELKDEFLYPEFIKSEASNLPDSLKLIYEKNND